MRKLFPLLAFTAFAILFANPAFSAEEKTLYDFTGGLDGGSPQGGVVRDAAGNLYGVTSSGGTSGILNTGACWQSGGCGVAFKLTKTTSGNWKEKVIYNFCPVVGCVDGADPVGGLVMDASGDLYGMTYSGGAFNFGVVFELIPIAGTWQEIVLHHFCSGGYGCPDGAYPESGLLRDGDGNLWGTASAGGVRGGVAFEITTVSNGWVETVLYPFCQIGEFCSDGIQPKAGLTLDSEGNAYGTTYVGGNSNCAQTYSCGTVFKLSSALSGFWPYTALYDFCPLAGCLDGALPLGGVTFSRKGNLYGTASFGGTKGGGVLFQLTPGLGETWSYLVLHNFCSAKNSSGNCLDGAGPSNGLIFDSAGNLYGTTGSGGTGIGGVVFKLTFKSNGWEETVLHNFCIALPCSDGSSPSGTLIFDPQGHLYGTTAGLGGGNAEGGAGAVFEIIP